MTPNSMYLSPNPPGNWLNKSEAWLDSKGRGAWIAAMVVGFVVFWPLGLALLAYMIWSKRMFKSSCGARKNRATRGFQTMKSSGNTAFDAYKVDTLNRLQQEQSDFEAFMARLRAAKDKAEFDQFMQDRAATPPHAPEPDQETQSQAPQHQAPQSPAS